MKRENRCEVMEAYNSFRGEMDTDKVWNLRQIFLRSHYGTLADDKLICLSYCFINNELYGCRYPPGVMTQLNLLTAGLSDVTALRRIKKAKKEVKFVRPSESTDRGAAQSQKHAVDEIPVKSAQSSVPVKKIVVPWMLFVKAETSYKSTDIALQSVEHLCSAPLMSPSGYHEADCNTGKSLARPSVVGIVEREIRQIRGLKSRPGIGFSNKIKNPSLSEATQSFVTPESSFKSTDSVSVGSSSQSTNDWCDPSLAPARSKKSRFSVGSKMWDDDLHKDGSKSPEEQKFYELSQHLQVLHADNNISRLQMALDKVSMVTNCNIYVVNKSGLTVFNCELLLDLINVSQGTGSNKKTAKHHAYDLAVEKILQGEFKVSRNKNGDQFLEIAATPTATPVVIASSVVTPKIHRVVKLRPSMIQDREMTNRMVSHCGDGAQKQLSESSRKRRCSDNKRVVWGDMSNFLIMENSVDSNPCMLTPVSILYSSAEFNKMPLSYEFVRVEEQVRCNLSINGVSVVECVGKSEADVKALTSEAALEKLRQICYTIRVKQRGDGAEERVSREEVMGNIARQRAEVIPDSNIGNRLLRKMGWVSGGIGREGNEGIAEPVKAGATVIHRQGLGSDSEKGIAEDFPSMIRLTLQNYAKSDTEGDIAFSHEFSKHERVLIHKSCSVFGLKSHSHGQGGNRYLVVSRKRNANELFDHIMQSGGETEKYEIREPSCKQM